MGHGRRRRSRPRHAGDARFATPLAVGVFQFHPSRNCTRSERALGSAVRLRRVREVRRARARAGGLGRWGAGAAGLEDRDVAAAVVYVLGQPPQVQGDDLLVWPTELIRSGETT
jgi:hypothetical protein